MIPSHQIVSNYIKISTVVDWWKEFDTYKVSNYIKISTVVDGSICLIVIGFKLH